MAERIPKKTKTVQKRGNKPLGGGTHPGFRMRGRPVKFQTAEQMEEAIDQYFEYCEERSLPLMITGLALALNMTRQGLLDYAAKDAFTDTIKRAKLIVENYAEFITLTKGHAGGIFALKNFSWKDKTEIYQETSFTQMPSIKVKTGDGKTQELSFNVGKKRETK